MSDKSPSLSKKETPTELYFRGLLPEMIERTLDLVKVESFTENVISLDRCAYKLGDYIVERLGVRPKTIRVDAEERPHLQVDLGERTDVLLIGHFDTVHPIGTLERNPARYEDGRLYGPGSLDMKGGCVMMVEVAHYLMSKYDSPNISLFFNSDEEMGSFASQEPLWEIGKKARTAMVFDFGDPTRALRNAARGVRHLTVHVRGKGGHAAYPERAHNPIDVIGKIVTSLDQIRDSAAGISISPTRLRGSERTNVISDVASVGLDVRFRYNEQFDKIEKFLKSFANNDFEIEIETLLGRPAFPANPNNSVLEAAQIAARELGWPQLHTMEARGASDANTIADYCDSIIDGLGGWGQGAHSDMREFLDVESLVYFSTLSAATSEVIFAEADATEAEAS